MLLKGVGKLYFESPLIKTSFPPPRARSLLLYTNPPSCSLLINNNQASFNSLKTHSGEKSNNQTSLKCATVRPPVIDSEQPSSIIKSPNIRCFVAKSVLSRFIDRKYGNAIPKERVNRGKKGFATKQRIHVWALDYR